MYYDLRRKEKTREEEEEKHVGAIQYIYRESEKNFAENTVEREGRRTVKPSRPISGWHVSITVGGGGDENKTKTILK